MKQLSIFMFALLLLSSCGDETSQNTVNNETATTTDKTNPDVKGGNSIDRPAYSFTYPSTWKIDSSDADFDYDSYFTIDGEGESFISVFIFHNGVDAKQAVEAQVQTYSADVVKNPEVTTFTKWGNLEGEGKLLKGKITGTFDGEVKIFAHTKGEKTFLMVEQYFASDKDKDKPGFEMIENSFAIK